MVHLFIYIHTSPHWTNILDFTVTWGWNRVQCVHRIHAKCLVMIAWTERSPKADLHSCVSWCDAGMFSQASHISKRVLRVNPLPQREEICSKWQNTSHQIRIQLQWLMGSLTFRVTHCADPEETNTFHPANG